MRKSMGWIVGVGLWGFILAGLISLSSPSSFAQTVAGKSAVRRAQAEQVMPAERTPGRAPPAALSGPPASGPVLSGQPDVEYYSPGGEPVYGDGPMIGYDYGPGYSRGSGPFGMGLLGGMWVRGEYLVWATKGMRTPPLVITSADPGINPADLHLNDNGDLGVVFPVGILYGGDRLNDDARSGARITFGFWLDDCHTVGVEADYWGLNDGKDSFFRDSTGNPILSRPFYNILTGLESSSLVAYPTPVGGVLHQGSIDIDTSTRVQGSGVRALVNMCCSSGCGTSLWNGCPTPVSKRVDLIAGYRFVRLDDSLRIREDSQLTPGGSFLITDSFDTENHFHGFDVGAQAGWRRGPWSLDVLSKVALGNVRSIADIRGTSVITPTGGATVTQTGGILAQSTNIGRYTNDEFAAVPELGFTVGYSLTPAWRVTAGYNFVYWSKVARAGDQIDRDVNPNLIPDANGPGTDNSHLRPEFRWVYDDFWAQGLTLGLEGNW